jgi:sigma-B regulation protein RsbU (phosphoserine phosphatase)
MKTEAQALEFLSGQIGDIVFGTAFLLFGLLAAAIAALRRRFGVQVLAWLALWSGMYGGRLLISSPVVALILPGWFPGFRDRANVVVGYLILVVALQYWRQLTRGGLRRLLKAAMLAGLAVAVAGIAWYLVSGTAGAFMPLNNLIATACLLAVITVLSVRRLAKRFLVLNESGVLAAGTLVFAAEALYNNLSSTFNYRALHVLDHLGFAVLLLSLAFVAARMVFANERRLLAIESELETARRIQASILPAAVPQLEKARVVAAYRPMAAVAGDFYDFLAADRQGTGFLIADVAGHGVPAALIASMLKVALRTEEGRADEPGELLGGLNRVLGAQLRERFVSAAYLWLDRGARRARYSAAGHPPLLHWRADGGELQRIESNGLLFGVSADARYPVRELALAAGDRLLLYTDGLVESRDAGGEEFGEARLGQVLGGQGGLPAEAIAQGLLAELDRWRPRGVPQQDDITLIAVDIL